MMLLFSEISSSWKVKKNHLSYTAWLCVNCKRCSVSLMLSLSLQTLCRFQIKVRGQCCSYFHPMSGMLFNLSCRKYLASFCKTDWKTHFKCSWWWFCCCCAAKYTCMCLFSTSLHQTWSQPLRSLFWVCCRFLENPSECLNKYKSVCSLLMSTLVRPRQNCIQS